MRDLKIPEQRHPEKARRPDNPQPKKPSWIRVKAPGGKGYAATAKIMRDNKLVTVCEEAGCPNIFECWESGTSTLMLWVARGWGMSASVEIEFAVNCSVPAGERKKSAPLFLVEHLDLASRLRLAVALVCTQFQYSGRSIGNHQLGLSTKGNQ